MVLREFFKRGLVTRHHKQALLEVCTKFNIKIVCVRYSWQSLSWVLTLEQQKLVTALGISFWINSYRYGDHHEEIVDLREQLDVRSDVDQLTLDKDKPIGI